MRWSLASIVCLAVVSGCPSPAVTSDSGVESGAPCTSNPDCDDGRFCNGAEQCMPGVGADARGCVVGTPPCMPSQMCIDVEGRCVTQCAIDPDADDDGVPAAECGGIDCNDADPRAFPTNTEVCDDLGHDEDCNPLTYGSRDRDGDGDVDHACCNTDRATMLPICGGDCADERRDVRSGLAESCDHLDNDCDGRMDEGVTLTGAPDRDLDLHGAMGSPVQGCAGQPGFSTVIDDCDDTNPAIFGAQLEICDGVDNDCDGRTDEVMGLATWYADDDADGFGGSDEARVVVSCVPVPGHVARPGDCDDARAAVHPGAEEQCNGIDDDCNGRADFVLSPGNTEDDDGDGAADHRCGGPDCDDATSAAGPAAPELMDGVDNDCNGLVDDAPMPVGWWIDRDGDGYGNATSAPSDSPLPIPDRVTRGGDCDDDDVHVHPGVTDACDGNDDDCDGTIDEGAPLLAFFRDDDHDGWAVDDPASIVLRCGVTAGVADRVGDCIDTDATRHPDAPELCNAIDDDCDAAIDEEPASLWYVDADGDGAGGGIGLESCMPIAGRVNRGGDCDDANALRFPGQTEACNGVDDDCDAVIDDAASASCATSAPQTIGASCVAGACALTCVGGFSDCDGNVTNGCEAPTSSDILSCGACDRRCAPRPHAPATCAASTCGVGCDLGWSDCDSNIVTGCETNTAADPRNCGMCGRVCTVSGDACVRGDCLPVTYPSTGTEGPLVVSGPTVLAPGIHQYTTITVMAGGVITTNGIGVLELRASGDVIIEGTIDLSGGRGGAGYSRSNGGGNGQGGPTGDPTPGAAGIDGCLVVRGGGGGEGGPGSPGTSPCLGGGGRFGGGDGGTGDATSGSSGSGGGGFSGGGGGYVGVLSGGLGGFISGEGESRGGEGNCGGGPAPRSYPGAQCPTTGGIVGGGGGSIGSAAADDLAVATTFRPGSGGGGGQGWTESGLGGPGGGGGGGGGGALRITSLTRIFVSPTGVVRANGGAGGSAGGPLGGQGGGGSGGVVFLAAPAMEIRGTVSAAGGPGNLGTGGLGGGGGPGRIRLSVLPERCTLFGTWTPAALVSGCTPTRGAPMDLRVYIDVFPF